MTRRNDGNVASDWATVHQLAERFSVSENTVLAWAKKPINPMPVHYPPDSKRWRAYVPEVNEWALATWASN